MSFCSQASEYWPLYRHFMRTREQYALALYERSRITWLDLRRNRRCKPGDFRATLVEFLSNFRRQLVASHWHRGDTQPEVREDQWRHRPQECDVAALEATSWYIWCFPTVNTPLFHSLDVAYQHTRHSPRPISFSDLFFSIWNHDVTSHFKTPPNIHSKRCLLTYKTKFSNYSCENLATKGAICWVFSHLTISLLRSLIFYSWHHECAASPFIVYSNHPCMHPCKT